MKRRGRESGFEALPRDLVAKSAYNSAEIRGSGDGPECRNCLVSGHDGAEKPKGRSGRRAQVPRRPAARRRRARRREVHDTAATAPIAHKTPTAMIPAPIAEPTEKARYIVDVLSASATEACAGDPAAMRRAIWAGKKDQTLKPHKAMEARTRPMASGGARPAATRAPDERQPERHQGGPRHPVRTEPVVHAAAGGDAQGGGGDPTSTRSRRCRPHRSRAPR